MITAQEQFNIQIWKGSPETVKFAQQLRDEALKELEDIAKNQLAQSEDMLRSRLSACSSRLKIAEEMLTRD